MPPGMKSDHDDYGYTNSENYFQKVFFEKSWKNKKEGNVSRMQEIIHSTKKYYISR